MNKLSSNRQKKEQIVAKIAEKAAKAKGMVFTNYQGLTHQQLEQLKKALKPLQAELAVTKNTLLKLALQKQKVDKLDKVEQVKKGSSTFATSSTFTTFSGPTATLFLYSDPIEPLKALAKTIKEFNLPARNAFGEAVSGGPTIKIGIIEGKELTAYEVLKLSTLPSREVLIAQLIFGMKAPIYGLHRAISWHMLKLVLTLKAIESKKTS